MRSTQILFVLVSLIFLLCPISAAESPDPAPTADFIRTSCGTTLYPDLCYASLGRYTRAVRSNPTRLARVAIAVSLANTRGVSAYLADISKQATDPAAAGALQDCKTLISQAADNMGDSLAQMRTLGSGPESVELQIDNVKTWMSSAITAAVTCPQGFEDMEYDGPIKTKVVSRMERMENLVSNALAIVNSLAGSAH